MLMGTPARVARTGAGRGAPLPCYDSRDDRGGGAGTERRAGPLRPGRNDARAEVPGRPRRRRGGLRGRLRGLPLRARHADRDQGAPRGRRRRARRGRSGRMRSISSWAKRRRSRGCAVKASLPSTTRRCTTALITRAECPGSSSSGSRGRRSPTTSGGAADGAGGHRARCSRDRPSGPSRPSSRRTRAGSRTADLKPSNVMIARRAPEDGASASARPRLRGREDHGARGGARHWSGTATDAPRRAFSPQYAAPEQASGTRTGPWTRRARARAPRSRRC